MCGIAGIVDLSHRRAADPAILRAMTGALAHRGPDAECFAVSGSVGLGFRRLAIVDLHTGDQPFYNEDGSIILVCNGEIYNADELRAQYLRGHEFVSHSDCEPVLHLYEEVSTRVPELIEGQFAFALYDSARRRLLLARDPFGVAPLYYAQRGDLFVFASEIKAILKHPAIRAEIDPMGLDQVVCFPGLVSPQTMFAGIKALPPGHMLICENGAVHVKSYWDVDYPEADTPAALSQDKCEQRLKELFRASVKRRLRADVPVGLYISGGLDSSLVAVTAADLNECDSLHSFSVAFDDRSATEETYQRMMAGAIGSRHREVRFAQRDILARLARMIHHAERPVKETYNTCALALSEATHGTGLKVILGGEGADEFFAGYPGYRFDAFRAGRKQNVAADERRQREILWGDGNVGYERNYAEFGRRRLALYAPEWREAAARDGALSRPPVDPSRLKGRHPLHQRSYLDYRLRLADHLLGDHGDHMLMANSVEGRYPFLDRALIEFACTVPPDLKLHGYEEKFILKQIAAGAVPPAILAREKFGFYSVSTPQLLNSGADWVHDLLCAERIRRDGYFCPETVAALKARYAEPGFRLDPRYEDDLLLIVLSFNLMHDIFITRTINVPAAP